jgi:hypothetical protein
VSTVFVSFSLIAACLVAGGRQYISPTGEATAEEGCRQPRSPAGRRRQTGGKTCITIETGGVRPLMDGQLHDCHTLEDHLREAIKTAEDDETKYHIREALQKRYVETR